MIGLLVSFVAGMRRWTAWSPLIVTAISLPFTILRWNNSNAWRAEVHRLAQHDIADLALAIAGGTALNYAVFGIGFGVAVAIDRIRRRRS